jgi:hypothetical protein
VNGVPFPDDSDLEKAEFVFPMDYEESQKPSGLTIHQAGWGPEDIGEHGWFVGVFSSIPIR